MSSSNARRTGHTSRGNRTPKKPKMSEEAWRISVATFHSILDNDASDDRAIQLAWDTLRQDYRNRFNAKVSPPPTQRNEEPFGLWAAENISGNSLQRVLCIIFRKELAECNHMTLLRSTASKASTTVWHVLLYFGASMFSESLLGHVRKRLRVFDKDPASGSSAFHNAYLKVLRSTAQRTKMVLDTTSICSLKAGRIFSSPDLTALASANPEFDQPSSRKHVAKTGSSHIKLQAESSAAGNIPELSSTGLPEPTKRPGTSSSARAQEREGGLHFAPTGGESIQPSIEFNVQVPQLGRAGHDAVRSHSYRAESEGQRSYLPSVARNSRPNTGGDTNTRRNPPRKGRPGPLRVGIAPRSADDALVQDSDNTVDPRIKVERTPSSRSQRSADTGPNPRIGSTIHCAPEPLQATAKRRPKVQESKALALGMDRPKRSNTTATRSDLLDQGHDWDDQTVTIILRELEAICSTGWTVVDGMTNEHSSLPQAIDEAGKKGSLLVPLKLTTGQRLLVVVDLNPSVYPGKYVMRYYDPEGPPDEDSAAEYKPHKKLMFLLSCVLPGLNLDPARWKSEYCVCPELIYEQDNGLSICLEAIYAVGGRPLPDTPDWVFWKHLLLGAFFPDDGAVQMRIAHYRDGTIKKLICQGQMSDGALVPQGRRVSPDIEYLGTAAMNPIDRIECRADNAKKIIRAIHESYRIFHNLQEQIDMARADLKTRIDKSTYIKDSLRHKLNIGDKIVLGVVPIKTEDDNEGAESFNRATLQQAIREHRFCEKSLWDLSIITESVRKALQELAIWRREANGATMEDDASLLNQPRRDPKEA